MFLRVFCQIAAALQEQGGAALAPGGVWSQAAGQFNGEQLAYVAAFASGAQLLFGDRPKDVTYRQGLVHTTAWRCLLQVYLCMQVLSAPGLYAEGTPPNVPLHQHPQRSDAFNACTHTHTHA